MPKFWLIWNPNGHMPTYRHTTEYQAREEAMRLARTAPGERFYVLAAVDSVLCPKPPVTWASEEPQDDANTCDMAVQAGAPKDDIPF